MICFENELSGQLTGMLVGLARATYGNEHLVTESTCQAVIEGLLAIGQNRDDEVLLAAVARVDEEKRNLVPMCYGCASPCGRTENYDMRNLWAAEEAIRNWKLRILSGLCDVAHAYPVGERVYQNERIRELLLRALFAVGEDWESDELEPIVRELDAASPGF